MQHSNHVDNFNRAIAFNFNQKDVTRFAGLASLMNRARRSGVPASDAGDLASPLWNPDGIAPSGSVPDSLSSRG